MGNVSPGAVPEAKLMPDSLAVHWPLLLAEMSAEQSGDDARHYRSGWSACMNWEARVPPDELSAEEREMWCNGYEDAMDAPLGSRPEL